MMTCKVPDLSSITDEEIIQLIECPKVIVKHAKKNMIIENGSERNDMELVFINHIYEEQQSFSVFLRRSTVFSEDFSVGMIWKPKDAKKMILLRYNGRHGLNRSVAHQRVPHIHRLLADDILHQNYDPHHAELTEEYSTMEGGYSSIYAEVTCDRVGISLQRTNKLFTGVVVHEDFESLPTTTQKFITNAADQQFTDFSQFRTDGEQYMRRIIA